jgi:hypothetical protein
MPLSCTAEFEFIAYGAVSDLVAAITGEERGEEKSKRGEGKKKLRLLPGVREGGACKQGATESQVKLQVGEAEGAEGEAPGLC